MIEKTLALKTESGEDIYTFTWEEQAGVSLTVTNYGAAIYRLRMADNRGVTEDIALTCDTMEGFRRNTAFFGATVGRVANRIKDGSFVLNGNTFQLAKNEGENHAHGGWKGFDKVVWSWEIRGNQVVFSYESPDGSEGYPGTLHMEVSYELTNSGEIYIVHKGESDRDTIVNTINHTYFHLGGIHSGKIYDERLKIEGDFYLETDEELIPTGQILTVKDTPYDFTREERVGKNIHASFAPLARNKGYDVTYVRNQRGYGKAATLRDEKTGRCLEVYTDYPSIHLYTGNFLNGEPGMGERCYHSHESLCLEAQRFPYACGYAHFGEIVLRAGGKYQQTICYKLYLDEKERSNGG